MGAQPIGVELTRMAFILAHCKMADGSRQKEPTPVHVDCSQTTRKAGTG